MFLWFQKLKPGSILSILTKVETMGSNICLIIKNQFKMIQNSFHPILKIFILLHIL